MTLNTQQQQAFDNITQWARGESDNTSNRMGLFGYAGTGKTYTVQRIAKSLKEWDRRYKIAFSAPTHKAVKVLGKMARDYDLKVSTLTTHKLLGLGIDYDHKGKAQLSLSGMADFSEYDLVVVDESSMISRELYSHIKNGADWLFMGDSAQLPPVDDEGALSPVFGLSDAYTLSDIVRYGGSILDHATNLRNAVIKGDKFKPVPYDDVLLGYENKQWLKEVFAAFDHAKKEGMDSDAVRVLACTNARVSYLNKAIRSHLYGKEAQPYIQGETLMAKEPIQVMIDGRPYQLLHSCQECTVISSKESTKRIRGMEFKVWLTDIETDAGDIETVSILMESEYESCLAWLSQWRDEILAKDKKIRGKEWGNWYRAQTDLCVILKGNKLIPRLQYAFALTVHQSQGSTFGTVFADNDYMPWIEDRPTMCRLLYVQATRASDKLILHRRS